MSALLFVGPSFPRLHALALPGIEVRPPAAQGDILAAIEDRPRLIGLVDGVFGQEPAVWHKEILLALEAGIGVLGAASMGALRAAELHAFGMEGVGTIFAAYRDGILEADDEVALLHGPAELGWPALSEPMVNLRATLARLVRAGVLGEAEAARAARLLAARFYPERTRGALEAVLRAEVGPARADAVARWARRLAVDAKRIDAARLVRRLRDRLAGAPRPEPVRFTTSRTLPLRRLMAERVPSASAAATDVAGPAVPDRLAGLPPLPERAWALLTLAAADNNLADELEADLAELLGAAGLERLHVAGELDSRDAELCGRFAILPTGRDGAARLEIVPRGPRNTGDPAVLRDLLRWALPTFPAGRRALVFWGHGEGTRIAIDDGARDALSIPELLAALGAGLGRSAPLDLVVFDACLMGKLELLADLAPFARVVVASGEVVPATGLPYHGAAAILAAAEAPEAAGEAVVEAFLDDAAARGQAHARLVVARTDAAIEAMRAVGRVGERLAELLPAARSAVSGARLLARTPRAPELVDAVDLLDRIGRCVADRRLAELADRAVSTIDRCVLRSRRLWPERGAMRGGLNLWFPTQAGLYHAGRPDYAARPAVRGPGAGWLRFLDRLHGPCERDEGHSAPAPVGLEVRPPP